MSADEQRQYLQEYEEHKEVQEEVEREVAQRKQEIRKREGDEVEEAVLSEPPAETSAETEESLPETIEESTFVETGVEFPLPSVEEMLEAGVHWGHQKRKWNPKMEPYIWGLYNRIHIIDLEKTREGLRKAQDFAFRTVLQGRLILYVGTKRQLKQVVQKYAESVQMPYVTERWLGGTLTNFITIRHILRKLEDIEDMIRDGTFDTLTKKERLRILRQKEKMERLLGGIRKLNRPPAAIFVADTIEEETAVREAGRLGIPVIAIVDTNSDPELVDFPIPGNDDSTRSVDLLVRYFTEAIRIAREMRAQKREELRQKLQAQTRVQRRHVRVRRSDRPRHRSLRGRRRSRS